MMHGQQTSPVWLTLTWIITSCNQVTSYLSPSHLHEIRGINWVLCKLLGNPPLWSWARFNSWPISLAALLLSNVGRIAPNNSKVVFTITRQNIWSLTIGASFFTDMSLSTAADSSSNSIFCFLLAVLSISKRVPGYFSPGSWKGVSHHYHLSLKSQQIYISWRAQQ